MAPVRKTPRACPSDRTVSDDGFSPFTTWSLPEASRGFQTPRASHIPTPIPFASRAASANISAVVRAPPVPSEWDPFIATFAIRLGVSAAIISAGVIRSHEFNVPILLVGAERRA